MSHRPMSSYNRLNDEDGQPAYPSSSKTDYKDPTKGADVTTEYSHESNFVPSSMEQRQNGRYSTINGLPSWLTRLRVWREDLLGLFVAYLAFVAILIILGRHSGLELPHWPFGISINALVAVFSTLFKMALAVPVAGAVSQLKWDWFSGTPRPLSDMVVFDKVSRGNIWHAAKLLVIQRAVHWASLGAVLFVLLIGIDPFFQQVIKFEPCMRNETLGSANVARVNNYSTQGIHTGAGMSSLDAPMQAAIYRGLYNASSPVRPTCVTGNCTFPDYRTAGFCHGCEDVTDLVTFTNYSATNTSFGFYDQIWSLPNMSVLIGQPWPAVVNMSSQSFAHHIPFALKGQGSDDVLMIRTDIIRFSDRGVGLAAVPKVQAQSCWLSPCVRTYSLSVNSTVVNETLISVEKMTNPPREAFPTPFDPWIAAPMPCFVNGTQADASQFTVQSDINSHPIKGILPNNQTAWVPDECIFSFGATLALPEYISPLLNGNVSAAPEDDYTFPDYMAQLCYGGNCSYSSIDTYWGTLADSITAHMRSFGDPGTDAAAQGQVINTQTCIKVYWPWLTFPAVILILTSTLFLATAVLSVSRMAQRLWKDSPLALLLLHTGGGLQDRVQGSANRVQMEDVGKMTHVQLLDGPSGAVMHDVTVRQHFGADDARKGAIEMDRF